MGDEYIKIQDLLDRASQSSIYSHLKIMLANTPLADVVPRETVDKLIHNLEQKRINDIENTAKIIAVTAKGTKMELNREQIIKALECCGSDVYVCQQCPIDEKIKDDCECGKLVTRNALALITSQEQRIKELTEENERLKARVLEENHLRTQAEKMLALGMSVVKADTVREVCQRIKEHFPYDADSGLYVVLDQIAKEMLEGENEASGGE